MLDLIYKERLEMIKLAFSDHSFVTVTNFDLLRAQGEFETKLLFDMTPLNGLIKQSLTRTFNAFDYSLLFESKPEMEIQQLFLTARTKRARHIISPNQLVIEHSKINANSIILTEEANDVPTKESNSVLFTPSFTLSKTNKSEILPFVLIKEITSKSTAHGETMGFTTSETHGFTLKSKAIGFAHAEISCSRQLTFIRK